MKIDYNADDILHIVWEITRNANPELGHDRTVNQIEQIFRKRRFYTTREYPVYRIKGKAKRGGRIDLIARRGKFRVAVEYDHKYSVKYKSFQKILQIKPDIAVGITGFGDLKQSVARIKRYEIDRPLYIVSLKTKQYKLLLPENLRW